MLKRDGQLLVVFREANNEQSMQIKHCVGHHEADEPLEHRVGLSEQCDYEEDLMRAITQTPLASGTINAMESGTTHLYGWSRP